MPRGNQRFTIYDMMEAKGLFEANVANAHSPDYKGPVEYPKMMYHPQGATRVIVAATAESTPFGPELRGEQREIIWEVAADAEEEAKLRALGWHDHPADAIKASGHGPVPPKSSDRRVELLEDRLRRLEAELAAARADQALGEATGEASKPGKAGSKAAA